MSCPKQLKRDLLPKNDQIGPKAGIFGQFGPGLFSALLMGRLVVVAPGLYLARHLFTLLSDVDTEVHYLLQVVGQQQSAQQSLQPRPANLSGFSFSKVILKKKANFLQCKASRCGTQGRRRTPTTITATRPTTQRGGSTNPC